MQIVYEPSILSMLPA